MQTIINPNMYVKSFGLVPLGRIRGDSHGFYDNGVHSSDPGENQFVNTNEVIVFRL